MGHIEGNFTPVLYIGRKVPKGYPMHEVPVSYTRRFRNSPYSRFHVNECLRTDKYPAVYFRTSDGNWNEICDLFILNLLC